MRALRQPPLTPHRGQPRTLTVRQTELLDQLEQLFMKDGFAERTLDDIASELRCSKMTLYTLAPSRDELILTVLRRFFDEVTQRLDAIIGPIDDPHEQIRTCVEATGQEMFRMATPCFRDVLQFATTRQLYEAFSRSCSDRLVKAFARVDGTDERGRALARFKAEVVRVVLDDTCSGSFEAQTELDNNEALEHLVVMVCSAQPPSDGLRQAGIKRIK
jgi:AcrR family transcriptional regulator